MRRLLTAALAGALGHAFWRNRARLHRGAVFVWLHHLYYPLVFKRRIRLLNEYAHELRALEESRHEAEAAASTNALVRSVSRDLAPYRATMPASPKEFLEKKGRRSTLTAMSELAEALPRKTARLAEALRRAHGAARQFACVPMRVRRDALFESSVAQVLVATNAQKLAGLHVRFVDASDRAEAGVDAGGLSQEFFDLLARELAPDGGDDGATVAAAAPSPPPPRRASLSRQVLGALATTFGASAAPPLPPQPLFARCADNTATLRASGRPMLEYYALGQLFGIAAALRARGESTFVPCALSRPLRKAMLGLAIVADDVQQLDPVYYKNRIAAVLEPGGVAMMCEVLGLEPDGLRFVATDGDDSEEGGAAELKDGGFETVVTEENKDEYVALLAEAFAHGGARRELAQFLAGWWEIVPLDALSHADLNESDLGLLLGGVPALDAADWARHALVTGVSDGGDESSAKSGSDDAGPPPPRRVVAWFWEEVSAMSDESRARLLQFSTGLSRIPAGGFAELRPPWRLHVDARADPARLPSAHTCFNTLDIPLYASRSHLKRKLAVAVAEGRGRYDAR